MKISDHLSEDSIFLGLKAENKDDAIRVMASRMKALDGIADRESFLAAVFEREKISSTGIGEGIAIPHARSNTVKKFIIAMGRFDDGVDFDSVDSKPVKLIFMMGTPKDEWVSEHLKFFAYLTKIIYEQDLRDIVLEAATPAEVASAFDEAEYTRRVHDR
jgi:fructose-specific phosphotransferase system IIA component